MYLPTSFNAAIIAMPVFFTDDDYLYYLEVLEQELRGYSVKLHAYCLMTPKDKVGISRVMQHLGRLYEETGSENNIL
jgi:hypothetical protein